MCTNQHDMVKWCVHINMTWLNDVYKSTWYGLSGVYKSTWHGSMMLFNQHNTVKLHVQTNMTWLKQKHSTNSTLQSLTRYSEYKIIHFCITAFKTL